MVIKNKTLYEKYFERLKKVRLSKKDKLHDAITKGDLDYEDDTYSEIGSTISSTSTKFSTKASTNARALRVQAKKEEKKRCVLKENSPYEDLALLNAMNDIVKQIDLVQDDIGYPLRLSIIFDQLEEEAILLQETMQGSLLYISSTLNTVWPPAFDPSSFPGPLGDSIIISEENGLEGNQVMRKLQALNSTSTVTSIKIDPLLIKPRLRTEYNWELDVCKN